jgi:hypothetical protein
LKQHPPTSISPLLPNKKTSFNNSNFAYPDPTLATQGGEINDASPLPTTVPIKNNMETLKSL